VRGADGSSCTPHAAALREPVRRAVAAVADAFRTPELFEPAKAKLAFRLAANDLTALAIVPPLLAALGRDAPGVDLVVRSGDREQMLAWLRADEVQLAFGVFPVPPAGTLVEPLLEEALVLLVRSGHPLLDGELTPARLVEYPALLVSPRGDARGVADDALARSGSGGGWRRRCRTSCWPRTCCAAPT
jgi:DNA-binding transcriptional LysR family regulator